MTFNSGRQSHGDYAKCFLFWERILEQTEESRGSYNYGVVTAKYKDRWMERQRECLVPLLKRRMSLIEEKEAEAIPPYIGQLFDHFCDQKSSVNLSCIRMEIEFMEQSLREILFQESEDGEYAVNIESLIVILPNLKSYIDENGESVNICLQ